AVGIWSPADNSLAVYASAYGAISAGFGHAEVHIICGIEMGNIMGFGRTPDRTKLFLASAFSDNTLCRLDPSTGEAVTMVPPVNPSFFAISPDNHMIAIGVQSQINLYDSQTFVLLKSITSLNPDLTGGTVAFSN